MVPLKLNKGRKSILGGKKMNKPRFFSVLIVFLSILLLVNSGFTVENSKARELGEKELSKYLVKCGDNWYIKRRAVGLVGLRREGNIDLREMVLSESDKLNGLEFKGVLIFNYYGPSREFNSWDNNTWGEWKESKYFIDIIIIKQNSQWSINKSSDLFRGATYTTINCNDLPRKELILTTEAVPIELLDVETKWIKKYPYRSSEPIKARSPKLIVVPAIQFRVKNISQNTINSLSFEAHFEFKSNSKYLGASGLTTTVPLPIGEISKDFFQLRFFPYSVEGKTKESFFNNPAWKTILVELFVKKDKFLIPLGKFEVSRRIEEVIPLLTEEKIKEAMLDVEPNIIGELKTGFKIEKIEVSPSRVKVILPENLRIGEKVSTLPRIDISSLTESAEFQVDLILPHPDVRLVFPQTKVKVRIIIKEIDSKF